VRAASVDATRTVVLGPFWRDAPPVDNPADLGSADEAGEPLAVSGTVRDPDGDPLIGAEVDLWQADHNGTYDVQLDRVPHLRGRQRTNDEGRYEFVTVVPPPMRSRRTGQSAASSTNSAGRRFALRTCTSRSTHPGIAR
jgi:catechol 1,2-dioxygenase